MFHVFGALAEFERAIISQRTKAGMRAAKAKGIILGPPRALTNAQITKARRLIKTLRATIRALAAQYQAHPHTLIRALK